MLTHKTKNCHKSVCSLLKLRAPSLMAENNFDWQLYTNATKIGICISALMMHTEVVSNLVYLSLSNNNKEHLFRTVAKNWKNCAIINIVAASPYQISQFFCMLEHYVTVKVWYSPLIFQLSSHRRRRRWVKCKSKSV